MKPSLYVETTIKEGRMSNLNLRTLNDFRRWLQSRGVECSVTLFGSRARGDFSSDSDMDVLVVVPTLDAATERNISECAWEASLAQGIPVVPLVFSKAEWEEGPARSSLLALAVAREGIPL